MQPKIFSDFHTAYLAVLEQVYNRPQFTRSRRNTARECLNMSFTLSNPRRRTPNLPPRKTNIIFNWAEALWYLAGRSDMDMIGYYAPRLRDLATDAGHLTGTAYGTRLFHPRGDSQFDHTLQLLSRDPGTKRASMVIMRPDEFADPANPDVACTIALQLILREDRLHTVCFMRGNDATLGLLCDVFSFTTIAEFAAIQLGVPLGTYTHHVTSMHLNEPDLPRVHAILARPSEPPASAPAMPADTTWDTLDQVLKWEEDLRVNRRRLDPDEAAHLPLDPYWQQVLLLLETYRQIIHESHQPVDTAVMAALTTQHRDLVTCRWPDRISEAGR